MRIETSEIITLLSQTPIFGYLDPGRINRLAGLFKTVPYRKGDVLFSVGDDSEELFILCEGQVALEVDRRKSTQRFTTLHRGDFFGEEALLVDDPRYYRAVALEDGILLSLNVDDYLYIYAELPGIEEMLDVSVHSRKRATEVQMPWLGQDEFVHVISRKHPAMLWVKLSLPLLVGMILLVLSLLLLLLWMPERPYGWITLGIGLPVSFFWAVWELYDWRNDYFVLTNKRVVWIEKVAMVYDSRREAPLRTIMSVGLQKSRLGSLFGFADVVVLTYVGTIRLQDLPKADTIATLVEAYWHKAEDHNRREEAEIMAEKLHEKLDFPEGTAGTTRASVTRPAPIPESMDTREPGFFQWLFRDFIRLRYEQSGAITYRKHWFVLIQKTWLPVLLIAAAVAAIVARLSGSLAFVPLTPGLVGASVFIFVCFVVMVYQYADWRNDIFQITLDQIVDLDRKPLGKVRRRSAPLENVLSIEYERKGFWGYLFNFGTVYISVGSTELTFDYVYNPSEVQQDIFYRMGERLDQIQQFKVEGERERISEWIASYHRRTTGQKPETPPSATEGWEEFQDEG
ncbi:MAG: cyclic nucleotide-binding domain-containing protein [Anaerolineaceae bacterium]|nr:cyclic nucleotide-binding domain-containing protein [Anaerolineaceae bacterium]